MNYHGKLPITIVTGCLGSGKTTLIQSILSNKSIKEDIAIIVNEFGKVGLDHHLLKKVEEKTLLLNGGCICCNSREDLEKELKNLLYAYEGHKTHFDRVIIETTGLADPAPILFTILNDPILQKRYIVECVITTVDAVNGKLHLDKNPEIHKQLAIADKVIITKTDIANESQINDIISRIHAVNPSSEVIYSNEINESILHESTTQNKIVNISPLKTHYADNIKSISFTFEKPLNWIAFGLWLSMLLHAEGESVLRVKGLLDVGEDGPIVLNGVQHIIHPPQHLDRWPENDNASHIVFILRNIEPEKIKESLMAFQDFLDTKINVLEYPVV